MRSGLVLPPGVTSDNSLLTTRTRLRTKPLWYNGLRCGESFSDPHEGVLEYHIIPHDRYASFIDLDAMRIDVDESGCPVMLEIDLFSAKVLYDNDMTIPIVDKLQRHRFLDFPVQHHAPRIHIDHRKKLYRIVLSRRIPVERWAFAPGAAWEVDADQCLVGIWLADPVYDPSGCRRAAWRAGVWSAYRHGRLSEIASVNSHPERGWLSLPKIFA